MTKKTDIHETDPELPVVKPDPDYPTVQGFAARLEHFMNEAYQQSQPDAQPEHHQKFADWCNRLGDIWREVKQHVK